MLGSSDKYLFFVISPGKVKDRNGLKMMSPGNTGIDLHSVLSMEILEQDNHYDKYASDVSIFHLFIFN